MNNFKGQFEKIQVPDDIDFILTKAMKKGRHGLITKRFITSAIILCLFMTGLFGTCYAYPVAADVLVEIPFVGSIFKMFSDKDLKIASEKGLTHFSSQQQTKDGTTVAIKEFYYDKANFSVGIIVEGKNPYNFDTFFSIYYDNKLISSSTGGGNIEVSKNCFYRTINIPLTKELPDKCNIKLIGTDSTGVDRKFEFDIPIDYSKVEPLSKNIKLMKTFKDWNRIIIIKNIIFTPVSTTIKYEYTCPKDEIYNMQLMDEKGTEVLSKGSHATDLLNGSFKTYSATATFGAINNIPKYLTLNIYDYCESKVLDIEKDMFMSIKLELK